MHVDFEVQMIVLKYVFWIYIIKVFRVQPGEKSEGEGEKIITCKANQILKMGVVGTAFGNVGIVTNKLIS
jgi:hypothetical protein